MSHVFQALADPTRRAVVERLARGPASTTELARPFDMALPSFAQHLAMLERCWNQRLDRMQDFVEGMKATKR
jgi:DNA-binding transcriptional ArsR family regulator